MISSTPTPPNADVQWALSSLYECKKFRLASSSQLGAAHPSCDSPNTSRFASRLVQAMSALPGRLKTRRAPCRHCRDARRGVWLFDYGQFMISISNPPFPRAQHSKKKKQPNNTILSNRFSPPPATPTATHHGAVCLSRLRASRARLSSNPSGPL